MQIDAGGKACPQPVLMTEEAFAGMTEGIVEVVVDNEESALNVAGFAAQKGMSAETKKEGKDWRVKVAKACTCTLQSSDVQSPEPEKKKTLMLIVGIDSLGRDEDLGKKLVKGFFDTMKVHRQLPHTIFFLNAGVKLTTVNGEVASVLKEIEGMGVEIYSCGTCLKHYDLEARLRVGRRGTTNHIVEGLQDFDKAVWV